ncbi:MAG: hypothetical protein JW725_04250 [Candidatus Babeliaceae bacterium]|nr:hypothetical protein [Candidatus Babeliaceae bacterium]
MKSIGLVALFAVGIPLLAMDEIPYRLSHLRRYTGSDTLSVEFIKEILDIVGASVSDTIILAKKNAVKEVIEKYLAAKIDNRKIVQEVLAKKGSVSDVEFKSAMKDKKFGMATSYSYKRQINPLLVQMFVALAQQSVAAKGFSERCQKVFLEMKAEAERERRDILTLHQTLPNELCVDKSKPITPHILKCKTGGRMLLTAQQEMRILRSLAQCFERASVRRKPIL